MWWKVKYNSWFINSSSNYQESNEDSQNRRDHRTFKEWKRDFNRLPDGLTLNKIFEDDLVIFEDPSDLLNPQNIESDDYKLFKDIEILSLNSKRNGTRYTEAQLDELKLILEKYPAHQKTIRNRWNIPISTFRFLKKEIDGQIEE